MNAGAVILGSVLVVTCLGDGTHEHPETTTFDPCKNHENDKKCQTLWKTQDEVTTRPMGNLYRMSPFLNGKWNAFPSFRSNFDGYDWGGRAYDFNPTHNDIPEFSLRTLTKAYHGRNELNAQKPLPGPDYVDNTEEDSPKGEAIDSDSRRKGFPLVQFSLRFK
ncbi:hypothetical protein PPYR_13451 [Photinus pyralis]|uniref:Uncharacterized protein n=1 Tax=Photinus pyralis TaxID=7054 RepID=A0A1Y1KHG8_PHOPY|nr:uncharacterized protein LOC116178797 [Photinus pyralis]KAB0793831.1 hypothetical protein PPYR_13451 [Photinus pyralis]